MANVKISALPAGSALAGTEVAPFVQSAATVKITAAQIQAYLLALSSSLQVLFNNGAGALAGDSGFKYDPTTNTITLDAVTPSAATPVTLRARSDVADEGLEITATDGVGGLMTVKIGVSDLSVLTDVNLDTLIAITNANAGNTAACHISLINDQNDVLDFSILSSTNSPARGAVVSIQGASTTLFFNTLTHTVAIMDQANNVVVGGSNSHATNATDGFLYIPKVAGQPTGTPAHLSGNYANAVPLCYDTANHKFWVYDTASAAWRGVVLT